MGSNKRISYKVYYVNFRKSYITHLRISAKFSATSALDSSK